MSRCVAALLATVRLFSCVFHHVALQMLACGTWVVAHLTTVRFLSGVFPHMTRQTPALLTWIITNFTTERLLFTVNLLVYPQSGSCNRGEAAPFTCMESLASVFRNVSIQLAGASTGEVTLDALEILHPCVSLHVSFEVAWLVTWVLTLLTLEWFLTC